MARVKTVVEFDDKQIKEILQEKAKELAGKVC
jgi:hypothetical protein